MGGRGGALVEEAKKLMADDDEQPAEGARGDEEGGPKIKMGKIGKKKSTKTPAAQGTAGAASENYTKKIAAPLEKSKGEGGAFSENDIEFMKKAIQILCQSTNPLGKSIDYVTDDVDSMSKEYEHWRKDAIHCTL